MDRYNSLSGARICSCPMISSSVLGRIRTANGAFISMLVFPFRRRHWQQVRWVAFWILIAVESCDNTAVVRQIFCDMRADFFSSGFVQKRYDDAWILFVRGFGYLQIAYGRWDDYFVFIRVRSVIGCAGNPVCLHHGFTRFRCWLLVCL